MSTNHTSSQSPSARVFSSFPTKSKIKTTHPWLFSILTRSHVTNQRNVQQIHLIILVNPIQIEPFWVNAHRDWCSNAGLLKEIQGLRFCFQFLGKGRGTKGGCVTSFLGKDNWQLIFWISSEFLWKIITFIFFFVAEGIWKQVKQQGICKLLDRKLIYFYWIFLS